MIGGIEALKWLFDLMFFNDGIVRRIAQFYHCQIGFRFSDGRFCLVTLFSL
jgi:hypothetical protein